MKHISSRALRFIALLMLTVFGTAFANAQYYINVWKKDGTRAQYAVPDVNQVTFNSFKLSDFNPEYVDLGLSVKWATCNLGSMKAYQLGDYFEWGSPKDLGQMTQHSWYDSSTKKFTKYVVSPNEGQLDMRYRLQLEDDAAYVAGGAGWRIPTDKECSELVDSCIWTLVDSCGVQGYRVSSKKNSNSIFLPFSGYVENNDTADVDTYGYYMSNTLGLSSAGVNSVLYFSNTDRMAFYGPRLRAIQIRPVYTSASYEDMVRISNLKFEENSYDIETGQYISIKATYDKNIEELDYRKIWSSSDSTVASVSIGGEVYGVSSGVSYITVTVGNVSKTCAVYVRTAKTVKESVDLGLSVKWATCNIGASKPEYFGSYYAWGETEVKSEYNWQNYKWAQGKDSTFTKYCSDSDCGYNGFEDDLTTLSADDDVAVKVWGGDWRMPTIADYKELLDSCNKAIVERNGILLMKLTSKVNGDSIFFPYSGYYGNMHYNSGYVMTMTSDAHPKSAVSPAIEMIDEHFNTEVTAPRYLGFNVRPVKPYDANEGITGVYLDNDKLEILTGKSYELHVTGTRGTVVVSVSGVTWTSDNNAVARVNNGVVTAAGIGTCNIIVTANGHSDTCVVTVPDTTPKYVDLGLSVRWATFNVGAYKAEMAGDYFAFGATDTTTVYDLESYIYGDGYDGYYPQYKKYVTSSSYGTVDGKKKLDPEDDVASVKWGNKWHIPSLAMFEELADSCTWEWIDSCGMEGYLITSDVDGYTDRSIFLPAAGYMREQYLNHYNYGGSYWTNSISTYYGDDGENYYIHSYSHGVSSADRYYGLSVRPITYFEASDIAGLGLVRNSLTLVTDYELKPEVITYDASGRVIKVEGFMPNWASDNPSVATVVNGVIIAKGAGTCKLTASVGNSADTCRVTVYDPDLLPKESVDLGLSVKWATFNLGAFSPEMAGDYYSWGELEPYYMDGYAQSTNPVWRAGKEAGYDWVSYFDTDDEGDTFIKYDYDSGRTNLAPADDAVTYKWGASWRTPSAEEFEELLDSCTWELIDTLGVEGYLVTSNVKGFEGNSIFLPFTGYYDDTDYEEGEDAYYWSSTISSSSSVKDLGMFEGDAHMGTDAKYYGQSYRPVQMFDISSVDSIMIDLPDSIAVGDIITLSISGAIGERVVKVYGTVSWSSSDADVLKIENGEAMGLGVGESVVTLTAGTTVKKARIKVKAASTHVAPPKPLPGPYIQ